MTSTKTINTIILTELKNGNKSMFNVVFNSYYGNVKQFLHDLFKSNSQAEQLAEKVFIRLWTTKHKIDTDGYLSNHIFETMCEIATKELRVINYETKQTSGNSEELRINTSKKAPIALKVPKIL